MYREIKRMTKIDIIVDSVYEFDVTEEIVGKLFSNCIFYFSNNFIILNNQIKFKSCIFNECYFRLYNIKPDICIFEGSYIFYANKEHFLYNYQTKYYDSSSGKYLPLLFYNNFKNTSLVRYIPPINIAPIEVGDYSRYNYQDGLDNYANENPQVFTVYHTYGYFLHAVNLGTRLIVKTDMFCDSPSLYLNIWFNGSWTAIDTNSRNFAYNKYPYLDRDNGYNNTYIKIPQDTHNRDIEFVITTNMTTVGFTFMFHGTEPELRTSSLLESVPWSNCPSDVNVWFTYFDIYTEDGILVRRIIDGSSLNHTFQTTLPTNYLFNSTLDGNGDLDVRIVKDNFSTPVQDSLIACGTEISNKIGFDCDNSIFINPCLFNSCTITNTNWTKNIFLSPSSFTNCDLQNSVFDECDLQNTRFDNCDLRQTNFSNITTNYLKPISFNACWFQNMKYVSNILNITNNTNPTKQLHLRLTCCIPNFPFSLAWIKVFTKDDTKTHQPYGTDAPGLSLRYRGEGAGTTHPNYVPENMFDNSWSTKYSVSDYGRIPAGDIMWTNDTVKTIINKLFFRGGYLYCITRMDIIILSVSTGNIEGTYPMHNDISRKISNRINIEMAMSPNGQYIALLPYYKYESRRIYVYDTNNLPPLASEAFYMIDYSDYPGDTVNQMSFSSTTLIVSIGSATYFYNIADMMNQSTTFVSNSDYTTIISGTQNYNKGVLWNDNKLYLVYSKLQEIDLTTNTLRESSIDVGSKYKSMDVCDNYMIIGINNGMVKLYNISDLSHHKDIEPPFDPNTTNYVYDLTINKDATLFAVTYRKYDGVHVYNMEGELKFVSNHVQPNMIQSNPYDTNLFAVSNGLSWQYDPSLFKVSGDSRMWIEVDIDGFHDITKIGSIEFRNLTQFLFKVELFEDNVVSRCYFINLSASANHTLYLNDYSDNYYTEANQTSRSASHQTNQTSRSTNQTITNDSIIGNYQDTYNISQLIVSDISFYPSVYDYHLLNDTWQTTDQMDVANTSVVLLNRSYGLSGSYTTDESFTLQITFKAFTNTTLDPPTFNLPTTEVVLHTFDGGIDQNLSIAGILSKSVYGIESIVVTNTVNNVHLTIDSFVFGGGVVSEHKEIMHNIQSKSTSFIVGPYLDLSSLDLSRCNLEGIDMTGCDLTNTILNDVVTSATTILPTTEQEDKEDFTQKMARS